MWLQHYKPMLEQIMEQRLSDKIAQTGGMINYLMQKANNPEPLPFRITTEYSNIRTVGFLDTAAAIAQFVDRRLLEPWMARTEVGLAKYNDEMAAIESAARPLGGNLLSTQMNMNSPQTTPSQGLGTPQLANQGTSNFGKGFPSKSSEY